MRSLNFLILIVLLASAISGCVGEHSRTTRQDLGIRVLQAIDYADLTRSVIRKDCRRNPILASRVPACLTIDSVPDSAIEEMALPHLLDYLSDDNLDAALAYWDTPEGSHISSMLVRQIAEDRTDLLTDSEIRSLDGFSKSQAGLALGRLADNRNVSLEIIREIGAYAP